MTSVVTHAADKGGGARVRRYHRLEAEELPYGQAPRRKGGGVTASYGSVFPRPGDHTRKEEEREKADLWVLSCKGGASIWPGAKAAV
jgi:hypothetical protein